ncbi:MAG: hypothetical protein NC133_00125 [Prevotella sp.]|nr:hypothetical protein [Prevotella sp.]
MRNIWLLLKNYFLCGIGNLRRKNARTKTLVGITTLILIYAAIFALLLLSMLAMAEEGAELGMQASVLASGLIISVFLSVVFSLQKITGGQKASDNEMLLSMPLKKIEIMIAKALSRFAFNLAIVVLFFLPSIIAYLVYTPFNILATIGCFVVMFLIPFMAVGLSYLVDYVATVSFSSSKFGNLAKAFLSLITLIGIMVIYEFFVINIDNTIMLDVVNWMITFNPAIMLPLIVGAISIFILGNWLNAKLLNRENRAVQAKPTRLSSKQTTPLMSLLKNESNRYFNSPTLMLNTMLGPLFMVCLTGYLTVDRGKIFTSDLFQSLGINEQMIGLMVGVIFAVSAVLTYPAAVSISLEGKQLWILRSMPIPAHTILTAKVLFNILLIAPLNTLCAIVLQIVLHLSFLDFMAMLLIPLLAAVLVSYTGILINLFLPKFEFENENTVIKQSLSATIMMLGGMLVTFGLVFLAIVLIGYVPIVVTMGIIIGILATANGIVMTLVYTIGQRIFNHL